MFLTLSSKNLGGIGSILKTSHASIYQFDGPGGRAILDANYLHSPAWKIAFSGSGNKKKVTVRCNGCTIAPVVALPFSGRLKTANLRSALLFSSLKSQERGRHTLLATRTPHGIYPWVFLNWRSIRRKHLDACLQTCYYLDRSLGRSKPPRYRPASHRHHTFPTFNSEWGNLGVESENRTVR